MSSNDPVLQDAFVNDVPWWRRWLPLMLLPTIAVAMNTGLYVALT